MSKLFWEKITKQDLAATVIILNVAFQRQLIYTSKHPNATEEELLAAFDKINQKVNAAAKDIHSIEGLIGALDKIDWSGL